MDLYERMITRPDKETVQRILASGDIPIIDRHRTPRLSIDLPADYDGPVMIIRTRTIHVDKEATAGSVDEGMRKMRLFATTGIRRPSDEFYYRLIPADDWQYYYDTAKANLKEWPYEYNPDYTFHAPADWQGLKYLPAKYELKEF